MVNILEVILASRSRARREILERIGLKVIVKVANINERKLERGSLDDVLRVTEENSINKIKPFKDPSSSRPVISADTLIYCEGRVYRQPRSIEDAREILLTLRNRTHFVVSGYCVLYKDECCSGHAITKVYMRDYSLDEIEYYLDTGEWRNKAGAYAIQGIGAFLIKKIEGCFYNVVGLPLAQIIESLRRFGLWPP